MTDVPERVEREGFELDGVFYRWSLTDQGKDLMLIDRFCQMPIPEFFEMVEDGFDRGRVPVLLAMIATSLRAGHPDWSVQRIAKLVEQTHLSDIEFLGGDLEEDEARPPDLAQQPPDESEKSPSNGSLSSPIPVGSSSWPT